MYISINKEEKIAMFYITKEEELDKGFIKELDYIVAKYVQDKYITAICVSGDNPIENGIDKLLKVNSN